jgi:hypothetical protein
MYDFPPVHKDQSRQAGTVSDVSLEFIFFSDVPSVPVPLIIEFPFCDGGGIDMAMVDEQGKQQKWDRQFPGFHDERWLAGNPAWESGFFC